MTRLVNPALVVVAVLMLLLLAVWAFQRRLIYLPYGQPGTPWAAGLPEAEEVTLSTADGLKLAAWLVPGRLDVTAIVFNGNAGNRSHRAPLAAALNDAGLSVLLVDYRGYGGNPGSPSEHGLLADARAARDFVTRRPGGRDERVVYYGESLGAAVAVALARERPPAALILRSPFSSLADAARVSYPFLPTGLLLRDRFDVTGGIAGVEAPVLVVAGEDDAIVPVAQSRRVAEAAPGPTHLVVIRGADHNDADLLDGETLMTEVLTFLEHHGLGPRPASP